MWKKFTIALALYFAFSLRVSPGASGARLTVGYVLHACSANFAKCDTARRVIDTEIGYGVIAGGPRDYQSTREAYYRSVGGAQSLQDDQAPIVSLLNPVQLGGGVVDRYLWTGKRYFFTAYRGGHMVIATFSSHQSQIHHDLAVAWCFAIAKGFLFGDLAPFPQVFREPGTSVRLSKREVRVGLYKCLRLDAKGPAGRYTIWLVHRFTKRFTERGCFVRIRVWQANANYRHWCSRRKSGNYWSV